MMSQDSLLLIHAVLHTTNTHLDQKERWHGIVSSWGFILLLVLLLPLFLT